MADITSEITAITSSDSTIKNSVYGKDVRGAMSVLANATKSALQKVNAGGGGGGIPDGSVTIAKLDDDVLQKLITITSVTESGEGITTVTTEPFEDYLALMLYSTGVLSTVRNAWQTVFDVYFMVFRSIDLNTYSDTIDLNTIFDDCARLHLTAHGTGSFENQTLNFPPVRNYDSYDFVFIRNPGLQLFISQYDNVMWQRSSNSDSWRNLSKLSPTVEASSGSGQATLTVSSNTLTNYTYSHVEGGSDVITIVVNHMEIDDPPAVIFIGKNSFNKTISFSGMKNAEGTAIEKAVINTAATALPFTQFTAQAGYAYKITISRNGTQLSDAQVHEFLTARVEPYYIDT